MCISHFGAKFLATFNTFTQIIDLFCFLHDLEILPNLKT